MTPNSIARTTTANAVNPKATAAIGKQNLDWPIRRRRGPVMWRSSPSVAWTPLGRVSLRQGMPLLEDHDRILQRDPDAPEDRNSHKGPEQRGLQVEAAPSDSKRA